MKTQIIRLGDRIRKIRAEELHLMMDSKVIFTLIDARDTKEFGKEHIPGAVSLPSDRLAKNVLVQRRKSETFVTYCTDLQCDESARAAKKLERYGFKNVLELRGGLEDWKKAGFPTER